MKKNQAVTEIGEQSRLKDHIITVRMISRSEDQRESYRGGELKVSESFFAQRSEIRGVVQVGYDPLPVPINKKIGGGGILLNTPEVAVVQPQQGTTDHLVWHPVSN